MKQISAANGEVTVVNKGGKSAGEKAGAVAAYVIAALIAVIVIGGLVWVAEVVWRAVL